MIKFFKNYTYSAGIVALTAVLIIAFGISAVRADSALSNTEIEADIVETSDLTPRGTIEFTMDARWGFVRGNPDSDKIEKIYDGEIYANSYVLAKIRLQKTLLFEKHDALKSETNPVSWDSKIYNHWDGVMVNVKAKTNAEITVRVPRGKITKTAQEWFELTQPTVLKIEGNEILVVKTQPKKRRRHAVFVWWGRANNLADAPDLDSCGGYTYSSCPTSCEKICLPSICSGDKECTADCDGANSCYRPKTPRVNFSGILTMDYDINVKLKKALRFESNDKIEEHDRNHVEWTSYITTGRDGLSTLMLPTTNSGLNSGFNIHFTNVYGDDSFYKRYTLYDVKEGIRETITVDDVDYILVIGYKTIAKKLVRNKETKKLYLIEDNIAQAVTDDDILAANGYTEDEAIDMDDDELESYEEGDELDYPDGTVVEAGNKTYLISNGVKRLLKNDRVKAGIPWARQLTKMLSLDKLTSISQGPDVDSEEELADNTLVSVQGETAVWRIRGGKRQVFSHAKIFNLHRLDWNKIKTITGKKLQEYDWAAPIEYPDGALIKVPTDPKVYLLANGLRRWIETEADLKGLGYKFSDIVDMPPTEIINYPQGDPVISDEVTNVTEF